MSKYTVFGVLSILLAIVFVPVFTILLMLTGLSGSTGLLMTNLSSLLILVVGIFLGFSAKKNGTPTAKILGTIGFIMNCIILIIPLVNSLINPGWSGFLEPFGLIYRFFNN